MTAGGEWVGRSEEVDLTFRVERARRPSIDRYSPSRGLARYGHTGQLERFSRAHELVSAVVDTEIVVEIDPLQELFDFELRERSVGLELLSVRSRSEFSRGRRGGGQGRRGSVASRARRRSGGSAMRIKIG